MNGAPTSFWGKLQRDSQDASWHPLQAHCADVAACCEALLTETALGDRLATLGGMPRLEPGHISRLSAIAALHDLGKFSIGFQNKSLEKPSFTCGHVAEILVLFGAIEWPEREHLCDALPFDDISSWGQSPDAAWRLLVAAISHHGRPTKVGGHHQSSWWAPARGLDPFEGIGALCESVRRWFPLAFAADCPRLPESTHFEHLFSGVVMLADWLGSDTRHFPFAESHEDRMAFARPAAAGAVRTSGIATRHLVQDLIEELSFQKLFTFSPRPAQAQVVDLPAPTHPSLTILESETGSGKTEAALHRFLALFQAGAVDGLYFALPTRTSATQIYRRVVAAVQSAFPDALSRPPVVLAVPGYLSVDDVSGARLPGFEVLWNDNHAERLRFRGWAAEHPKRYLAGAIAVGTVDQVLLSTLEVPHAHMRAAALSRHLLVVDEVHASDAYMTRLLESVLRFHLACGGHAFLMSATLGSSARGQLAASVGARETAMSFDQAVAQPYPVIWQVERNGTPRAIAISPPDDRTIRFHLEALIEEPERIAEQALDAARQGARVIVLRNTVSGCLQLQECIERLANRLGEEHALFRCANQPAPHHARYSKEDRAALDLSLEQVFGKGCPSRGVVVVATQTIQQSLDLDADVMFSDLCPMDVLLQRVGRLHRHARLDRPPGFETPTCHVLSPGDRELGALIGVGGEARGSHGFGTVYEDLRVLEATLRELEARATISTPSMNRAVVEATTHPTALDAIVQELGAPWDQHVTHLVGQYLSHRRLAGLNVVDRDQAFGDYGFPSTELSRRVATRLGESDRLVVFDPPCPGPFGAKFRQLTIPAWQARGIPDDAELRLHSSAGGPSLRFALGPNEFQYDRLGLRPLRPVRPTKQTNQPSEEAPHAP